MTEKIDLVSKDMLREATFAKMFQRKTPVTTVLFVSNIVFWGIAFVAGLFLKELETFQIPALADLPADIFVFYSGMKINALVADGEWWRLISSMWVHLGLMHLAFNAYGLLIFGRFVERFYDSKKLLTIYMFAGVAGAFASYFFVDNPSGGASGALYGLVGAMLVFGFKHRAELPARVYKGLTTGMLPWVVLNIGIGFLDALPFDNGAHIGGLIGGALAATAMRSQIRGESKPTVNRIYSVLFVFWTVVVLTCFVLWITDAIPCFDSGNAYLACYPE